MIRIITLNLNGIRSAARKGLLPWLEAQKADVFCVQEIKAHEADLDASLLAPAGLKGHFHFAERPGYSGVGVYSRKKPKSVRIGFGDPEFDAEGRYVEADFGAFTVVSMYLPSRKTVTESPMRRITSSRCEM